MHAARAVTQAQSVKQRINLLFIDCFKCLDVLPEQWNSVEMELDTVRGDLYARINDNARMQIFKNLPTKKALYPCLMAVNTGQAHFELADARLADC
jgi:hypothetical protein